jgi:hypothetical protein
MLACATSGGRKVRRELATAVTIARILQRGYMSFTGP